MKSKLILSLLLFFIGQIAFSQNSFGIKVGLNLTTAKTFGDNQTFVDLANNNTSYGVGFHIGLQSSIPLNKKLSFSPEFLLSNKGDIIPNNGLKSDHLYLDLPILLGIQLADKLSLLVGPEVGYELSYKFRLDGEKINFNNINDKRIALGALLGLRYNLSKLNFDIRYYHGFVRASESIIEVDETVQVDLAFNKTIYSKLRLMQFSVGYNF